MNVRRNAYWRSRKGVHFETMACEWLTQRGLVLLHNNFRCRCGEIDLIMRDGAMLVFVEVRYRASRSHGGAVATVTAAKQRRLRNAAGYFLLCHPEYRQAPCRFDIMGMVGYGPTGPGIEWIRGAFA